MLRLIFNISDYGEKKGEANKLNLRKKFIQSDGLKHLFGVRICMSKSMSVTSFQEIEISDFVREKLLNPISQAA